MRPSAPQNLDADRIGVARFRLARGELVAARDQLTELLDEMEKRDHIG